MSSFIKKELGVIAAIRDEVTDLLANPYFSWEEIAKNYFHSPIGLDCIICGVGKVNAAFAMQRLLDRVNEVLIVGTAGGLHQEKIGSLYLCTEFVEHDMDATGLGFPHGVTPFEEHTDHVISKVSKKTVEHIQKVCKKMLIELLTGRIMSGDQFINDHKVIAEKRSRFEAQLVDMESAAIAKICRKHGVGVTALRYISDNADHNATISWRENVQRSSGLINQIVQELFST